MKSKITLFASSKAVAVSSAVKDLGIKLQPTLVLMRNLLIVTKKVMML